MKPAPFDHHAPQSLDEALDLLAHHGADAMVLAGGQSLLPLLNLRRARPASVIDIGRVPGLDAVDLDDSGDLSLLTIGTRVTATDLIGDPLLGAAFPGLVEATGRIGHPQIRNRTTVGGSIAHADPAAELPCVLQAVGGTVTLCSVRGKRDVAAADFFTGHRTTAREPDELVTAVRLPVPPHSGWMELGRRPADLPQVGVFVGLSLHEDVIDRAWIGLGGVADRPVRASLAEASLRGSSPSADAFVAAAEIAADHVDPPTDLHATGAYRQALVATLVGRAFDSLGERIGVPA